MRRRPPAGRDHRSNGEVGVTLHGGEPFLSTPIDPAPLLTACGLNASDLVPAAAPAVAGVGLPFAYLQVTEAAVLKAVLPIEPLTSLAAALDAGGLCLFSLSSDAGTGPLAVHSRVIAGGVGEDPATGSAALGLGVWLAANGLAPADGKRPYTVRQGAEMGRPSVLECTVVTRAGQVADTQVRGSAVPIAQGRIARPA
jgi:trans-2,3-dihydro-3-hydroxyanthranilate isomerase